MAGKDLRRLSKTDLLELLIEQGRENLALKERVEQLEAELAQRRLQVSQCGSIAEAALKLSGVFEAAQQAIDLYRENVEQECEEIRRQAMMAAEDQAAAPEADGKEVAE
ncbi:MAG: DNA repair protein [Clostridia bacterium]|nr:DNA repair protein [Clostridia bacterium]